MGSGQLGEGFGATTRYNAGCVSPEFLPVCIWEGQRRTINIMKRVTTPTNTESCPFGLMANRFCDATSASTASLKRYGIKSLSLSEMWL